MCDSSLKDRLSVNSDFLSAIWKPIADTNTWDIHSSGDYITPSRPAKTNNRVPSSSTSHAPSYPHRDDPNYRPDGALPSSPNICPTNLSIFYILPTPPPNQACKRRRVEKVIALFLFSFLHSLFHYICIYVYTYMFAGAVCHLHVLPALPANVAANNLCFVTPTY